jgi:hypothetical protein
MADRPVTIATLWGNGDFGQACDSGLTPLLLTYCHRAVNLFASPFILREERYFVHRSTYPGTFEDLTTEEFRMQRDLLIAAERISSLSR